MRQKNSFICRSAFDNGCIFLLLCIPVAATAVVEEALLDLAEEVTEIIVILQPTVAMMALR